MISNILLIIIISFILLCYGYIIILYLSNKNKSIGISGRDIALEILNDDNNINVIENKNSIFSKYVIKRNMIKLSSNTYYKEDVFSNSISVLLSLYHNINNKYLYYIGKIFNNIRFISFSSIIVLLVSIFVSTKIDSKIGIFILILVGIYQYILNIIKNEVLIISDSKEIDNKVLYILNKFMIIDKIFFITTLISILRLVVIIMG